MREAIRRDPGLVCVGLAIALAAAIYAPTLGRGLVNYDDPWLVQDNWILQHASWANLHRIFFDLDPTTRFTLGAEYLPVRDLSITLDCALWGDWYQGFHATNLALYLASIALWFAALESFGIDRRVAGLAVLLWALHPAHAESVAWLSERKGLLGMAFAAAAALGHARFRSGSSQRWLVLAAVAAPCAVWSKAPAAFAIAAIGALELVLPARRLSWRRSVTGLVAIGVLAGAAFVPVVLTATRASVVGTDSNLVAGRLASVIGFHGFYLQLGAMVFANAVSYPVATLGPSALDLVLGGIGLVAVLATLVRGPMDLRAGAVLWLVGWLPISHLILPVHTIAVADRYLLLPTLGLALAIAAGVSRISRPQIRVALIAVLVLASALRALDAQSTWDGPRSLWLRAVESNPDDGNAWSRLAESYAEAGEPDQAMAAVDAGLRRAQTPALLLRKGLLLLGRGDRVPAMTALQQAAEAGEPKAMSNLALLMADTPHDALAWARRGARAAPMSAHAQRTFGKVALATGQIADALAAFERAFALEPGYAGNQYNLALGLIGMHREAEAIPHLEACLGDPKLAGAATDQLRRLGAR